MKLDAFAPLALVLMLSLARCSGSEDATPLGTDTADAAVFVDTAPPPEMRTISGVVYSFSGGETLAGAKVGIAELPDVTATTDADGRYSLEVPDGAVVTPFVTAEGFHTMHLQTFTMAGEDLENVFFQTPNDAIYDVLAAVVGVDKASTKCQLVSTIVTKEVQGLDFKAFKAYGAHGVEGVTASTEPALPTPIYFNKSVVPDKTLTESSPDGGVLWTEVPNGVYTVTAKHPTKTFASFVATCAEGRLVNANPPWGLKEL